MNDTVDCLACLEVKQDMAACGIPASERSLVTTLDGVTHYIISDGERGWVACRMRLRQEAVIDLELSRPRGKDA